MGFWGFGDQQRVQHRGARGAGRLAVVVGTLHSAVGTEHERGAVVPCIVEFLAQSGEDGAGALLVFGAVQHGDEAGAFHVDLVAEFRPRRQSGVHGGPALREIRIVSHRISLV